MIVIGDRANVVLVSKSNEGGDLVLYTHWGGSEIEQTVAKGIAHALKTGRNDDGEYAQRIVVDAFLRDHADSYDGGTGAGIYVGSPGEDRVVRVDFDTQTVEFGERGSTGSATFAEFVAQFPA